MMRETKQTTYEFGPFRLEAERRVLLRAGEAVALAPKAFDMLLVLVRHPGEVLEKDRLLAMLWPDSEVEEANLAQNVSALRKALGETPGERKYIVTVPGKGYKFAADVRQPRGDEAAIVIGKRSRATVVIEEQDETEAAAPSGERSGQMPTRIASIRHLSGVQILLMLGTVVLAVGGLLYWVASRSREAAPHKPIQSLAVLPFKPLVEDDYEYLGIGLADTLITRLSNLKAVVVRPTSAVLKYAGLDKEGVQVGRELGVESVLEGNIHRAEGRIRVTVRLLNVRDGTLMWADKFDAQFSDIFSVEDSISERVAEGLALQLSREERAAVAKHDTKNTDAHLLYLKGRYQVEKRTPDASRKGIDFFSQAIERDPDYALAYAGLAESYFILSITGNMLPLEAFPRLKEAAAKAIAIDPLLAEAHTCRGIAKFFHDWDWPGAESDFKRAIEINPNLARAHEMYGHLLTNIGRHEEALARSSRALELDPLSLIANAIRGQTLIFAGRLDDAVAHLQKTLEVEPDFWIAHLVLGKAYERKRMYSQAIAEFQKAWELSDDSPESKSYLGYTCAVSGQPEEARQALVELKEMAKHRYVAPKHIALIYAGLGDRERMYEWLEKAYEDRDISLTFIKVEPRWDAYRTDPRFVDLSRRVGF